MARDRGAGGRDGSGSRPGFSSGFELEQQALAVARHALEADDLSEAQLRGALAQVIRDYQHLLNRMGKLTRISDATQNRLFKAQQARERAERRYRGIYEKTFEGIFLVRLDGRIIDVNPAFLRIFGYASLEALRVASADNLERLYAEPGRFGALRERLREKGQLIESESQAVKSDGAVFWISQNLRWVEDPEGSIYLEGSTVDVTIRKETAVAMRQAMLAEKSANDAKTHFIASITHEFRTPLNGILGYAQILARESGLSERVRGGVEVIHSSAEQLLELINELLDFSKSQVKRDAVNVVDVDTSRFFRLLISQFEHRAQQKGIAFLTEIAPEIPAAWLTDEQKLRQILHNLISNAVKFTDSGYVRLRVFRVGGFGDRYAFEVHDTGVGFGPEEAARIFEPFEQVGSAERRSRGTGLGLAICKSHVDLLGGELGCESQPGEGSVFRFELVIPEGKGSARAEGRIIGYRGSRRRVLIADADAVQGNILVELLSIVGLNVALASSVDAFSKLCGGEWDLYCIHIDTEAGFTEQWLENLMASTGHKACCLAVTNDQTEENRAALLGQGCKGVLYVPVIEDELFEWLGAILGIEWERSEDEGADVSEQPGAVADLRFPDKETIIEFQALVARGKLLDLREHAASMAEQRDDLKPFGDRVASLCRNYNAKGLRALLQQALEGVERKDFPRAH